MLQQWESEEIFFDGDEYFERLLKDIDEAKFYITVEIYIFNDDVLGKEVADHLLRAHRRGVRVQVIVDGVGSYDFFDRLHGLFKENGVIVKVYNPLPFYHPYYGKLSLLKKLRVFSLRVGRLNKRNHRKIITIDQNIMYSGSYNITAVHTRHYHEKPWKDMGLRVTGAYVNFAVLNFKRTWKFRDYYRFRKKVRGKISGNWRQSPLRLNHTVFMKRYFYKNFLRRIHHSQDKIWLMTPYFIPKRRLIRALGRAAKRGVDVKIIISYRTDVEIFRWLQYFYYVYLLKKGVKVYQYVGSVLHAKNYVIDDWMTIGSTNLNHRSFLHDLEVDVVVQQAANKKLIEDHFTETIKSQEAITLEMLAKRPLWDKILSRLFFLFKYWF